MWGCKVVTSSRFLEPRKCRATCSGSMLVTSASFQRLISYTFSFCSWTSIFHRNRVRASFSTCRQQNSFQQRSVDLSRYTKHDLCWGKLLNYCYYSFSWKSYVLFHIWLKMDLFQGSSGFFLLRISSTDFLTFTFF